jgi:hypothetical protein
MATQQGTLMIDEAHLPKRTQPPVKILQRGPGTGGMTPVTSQPKTPSTQITIDTLTELLSDFEIECVGTFHTLTLQRASLNKGTFYLVYRYHDGHEYVTRTLPLMAHDSTAVRARHDKIIEHFNKGN